MLKNIKSLAPLLDRVLVQRMKAETKTSSGIFLPDSAVKELNEGKVLAAQFFAQTNLPKISAERAIAEATTLDLMDLDEASF